MSVNKWPFDNNVDFSLPMETIMKNCKEEVGYLLIESKIDINTGYYQFIQDIVLELIMAEHLSARHRIKILLKCFFIATVSEMKSDAAEINIMCECYVERIMRIYGHYNDMVKISKLIAGETINIINAKREHNTHYCEDEKKLISIAKNMPRLENLDTPNEDRNAKMLAYLITAMTDEHPSYLGIAARFKSLNNGESNVHAFHCFSLFSSIFQV